MSMLASGTEGLFQLLKCL